MNNINYQLQIHSPITPPNPGDIIIKLTDVKFHDHRGLRNPKTLGRALQKSMRSNKPGRGYFMNSVKSLGGNCVEFDFDFNNDMLDFVLKAQNEGKRVLFVFPKDGIPVYASSELHNQFNAKQKGLVNK